MYHLKVRFLASLLLVSLLLVSCQNPAEPNRETASESPDISQTQAEDKTVPATVLNLTAPEGMAVIRSEKASDALAKSAASLYTALKKKSDAPYTISDDWVKDPATLDPNAREILVGSTTRPATAELAKTLEALEFAIEVTENQLLIVGADDYVTIQAVNYFLEHYLSDNPEKDLAQLPIGLLHKGKIEATLDAMIGSEKEISYTMKKLGSLPHDIQGGVITEDAAYMAYTVVLRETEYAVIVRYDRKTWKETGRTGRIEAGHANDMTYRPDTNELYVVHSNNTPYVTIIDCDTLTVKDVISASEYVLHTLYYQPEQEIFISCSSTGRLAFYDADLKFKEKKVLSKLPKEVMDQSIYQSGSYIFYLFAKPISSQHNTIWIYDLDGKYVNSISVPELDDYEVENISILEDTLYIAAINWGSNRHADRKSDIFALQLNLK